MAGRVASLVLKGDSSGAVKAATRASKGLKTLSKDAYKSGKELSGLGKSFKFLQQNSTLLLGAVSAVAGGVIKSVSDFAKLEQAVLEVSTLFESTPEKIDGVYTSIQRVAHAYGQDSVTAAKAYYDIVSSGAEAGADANKILQQAAKAAIGGVTDISTAADGLTSVINAYGLSAQDATQVSDVMFQTVKAGKTTFAELSAGIGKVAPIASAAGVSMEELFAAIAETTKVGVSTPEAITSITAAMNSIIKPSSQAAKLAAELGIEFNAAALESKGLSGVLRDAYKATGGATEQMALLFGSTEALKSVMPLAKDEAASFTDQIDDMGNASGATEGAVDKMSESISFQMKRLGATVKTVSEGMGRQLASALGVSGWIDKLADAIARFAVKTGSISQEVLDVDNQLKLVESTVNAYERALREINFEYKQFTDESNAVAAALADQLQILSKTTEGMEALYTIEKELLEQQKELEEKASKWYTRAQVSEGDIKLVEDQLSLVQKTIVEQEKQLAIEKEKTEELDRQKTEIENIAKQEELRAKFLEGTFKELEILFIKPLPTGFADKLHQEVADLSIDIMAVQDQIEIGFNKPLDNSFAEYLHEEMGEVVDEAVDLNKVIGELSPKPEFMEFLENAGDVAEKLSSMDGWQTLSQTMGEFARAADALSRIYGTGGTDAFSQFVSKFSKYITDIQSIWTVLTQLPQKLSDVWNSVKQIAQGLGQAGSNAGGSVGGWKGALQTAGTIAGVVTAIIGFINLFKDDKPKRRVLGVSASGYEDWQTRETATASSGLVLRAAAERVGDEGIQLSKDMLQTFLDMDKALTEGLATLGYTVSLAGRTLSTGKPQIDSVNGWERYDVFGAREYDMLDTAALDNALINFVQQWVKAVAPQLGEELGNDLIEVAESAVDAFDVIDRINHLIELPAIIAAEEAAAADELADTIANLDSQIASVNQEITDTEALMETLEERQGLLETSKILTEGLIQAETSRLELLREEHTAAVQVEEGIEKFTKGLRWARHGALTAEQAFSRSITSLKDLADQVAESNSGFAHLATAMGQVQKQGEALMATWASLSKGVNDQVRSVRSQIADSLMDRHDIHNRNVTRFENNMKVLEAGAEMTPEALQRLVNETLNQALSIYQHNLEIFKQGGLDQSELEAYRDEWLKKIDEISSYSNSIINTAMQKITDDMKSVADYLDEKVGGSADTFQTAIDESVTRIDDLNTKLGTINTELQTTADALADAAEKLADLNTQLADLTDERDAAAATLTGAADRFSDSVDEFGLIVTTSDDEGEAEVNA